MDLNVERPSTQSFSKSISLLILGDQPNVERNKYTAGSLRLLGEPGEL